MKYDPHKIEELRAKGRTYAEICEILGCCKETIRRAVAPDYAKYIEKERERQRRYRLRNGINIS